jgi:hypothetical protein
MTSGCAWKSNISKKTSAKANQSSEREWSNPRNALHANPRNVFGLDGENTQENPNPQADSQSLVSCPPSPSQSSQGAAAEAEEAVAGAEIAAGAEAIMRKENGAASSIRRMTTIARITVQTRKDLRPSLKRRGRKRRELVP